MHTFAPSAECPQLVRSDSARTPLGVRVVSAMCPLYPYPYPARTRIYGYGRLGCLWLLVPLPLRPKSARF